MSHGYAAGCEADAASFSEDVRRWQLDIGAGSPASPPDTAFVNVEPAGLLWGPVALPETGAFHSEAHFVTGKGQQCAFFPNSHRSMSRPRACKHTCVRVLSICAL